MNTLETLGSRLERGGPEYREAFVASQLKRGIPFQARALRKQRGWSQAELADRSQLTQGAVSRALDPDYGNLTLNTILRIAAGFDVAFIGKFVPFSELAHWYANQSEESVQVPSFDQDQFVERIEPKIEKTLASQTLMSQERARQESGEPARGIKPAGVVPIDQPRRYGSLGGMNQQGDQGVASQAKSFAFGGAV